MKRFEEESNVGIALSALVLMAAQGLASSDLKEKIDSVLPRKEEERWLRIPWQPNLMLARAESQRTGRPMLIWIMDGNVLGCT